MRFRVIMVLGILMSGSSLASGPASGEETGIRLGGRAPASVDSGRDSFRVPMFTLPKKPESQPRWRLLGTCRSDVGTQQSFSGLGYGNCAR